MKNTKHILTAAFVALAVIFFAFKGIQEQQKLKVELTIPDKFTVINPNAAPPLNPVLVSSGYRGLYSYQSDLCNFYGRIGFGCPTCLSPLISNDLSCEIKGEGSGAMAFYKSSAIRWVKLLVYAPVGRHQMDRG